MKSYEKSCLVPGTPIHLKVSSLPLAVGAYAAITWRGKETPVLSAAMLVRKWMVGLEIRTHLSRIFQLSIGARSANGGL